MKNEADSDWHFRDGVDLTVCAEVTCKYCGQKRQSVQALVTSPCPRHPDGVNKGKHSPAR